MRAAPWCINDRETSSICTDDAIAAFVSIDSILVCHTLLPSREPLQISLYQTWWCYNSIIHCNMYIGIYLHQRGGDLLVGGRRFCRYEEAALSVGVSIESSVHYYMWLIGHVTSSRKKIAQLPMIERTNHPTGIHTLIRIRRKHHSKIK